MALGRIYTKQALIPNSSEWHLAEQRNAVPDLLPTQETNASSGGKGTEKSDTSQGIGAKVDKNGADFPRDKDGDIDVDAIRQTGDGQMMSDALRSEFGDEQANAMAQQFLAEAVQAQEKEKSPVKKNGSRQKAVDFWRDVAGRLNAARQPLGEASGTTAGTGGTTEKEWPKNLSEEELSVYLHNENGELDYGRTNEILDDIDRGLARVGRFSPEEERGRYGKAATASAINQGGINRQMERQRQAEARTGAPVTVAELLNPSQERDIDAENAEAFNRRYGELISYLKDLMSQYNERAADAASGQG